LTHIAQDTSINRCTKF